MFKKEKKYKLLKNDYIELEKGNKVYRIKALREFGNVVKGQLGGYIESEDNLSHKGNCWVYEDAIVSSDAEIKNNARVHANSNISGKVIIKGNSLIIGSTLISGNIYIDGNVRISGKNISIMNDLSQDQLTIEGNTCIGSNAYIHNANDFVCVGPIGSRDDMTTFYKTKNNGIQVSCGCFNNNIDRFESEVRYTHRDNSLYRNQYLKTIKYIKSLFKNEEEE